LGGGPTFQASQLPSTPVTLPQAPAGAPVDGSLNVNLNALSGANLGFTVNDPFVGKSRPLYHVNAQGMIDEVYETLPTSPNGERVVRTYFLEEPIDYRGVLQGQ